MYTVFLLVCSNSCLHEGKMAIEQCVAPHHGVCTNYSTVFSHMPWNMWLMRKFKISVWVESKPEAWEVNWVRSVLIYELDHNRNWDHDDWLTTGWAVSTGQGKSGKRISTLLWALMKTTCRTWDACTCRMQGHVEATWKFRSWSAWRSSDQRPLLWSFGKCTLITQTSLHVNISEMRSEGTWEKGFALSGITDQLTREKSGNTLPGIVKICMSTLSTVK